MTPMTGRKALAATLALAALSLATPRFTSAAPIQDYLALGDSMAFGETNWTQDPSNGDRGYVSLYANSLASQNGGVRPNVINLGVDGQTSTSFFTGGTPGNGMSAGSPGPQLNTNYTNPNLSENAMMVSTIASETAAGHNINTVSVQLGANDLLALVGQPSFFGLTPQQQQAQIGAHSPRWPRTTRTS